MTGYTVQPYQYRPKKARLRDNTALALLDLRPRRPAPTVAAYQPRKKRARLTGPYLPLDALKAGHTRPYQPTSRPQGVTRAGVHPVYDECFATADHVYEEPRGPEIVPIGILDERGIMLCRVTMPIKQQLGINTGGNAWTGDFDEEVEALVPADMLRISTGGGGVSEIDASEFDEDFDDEDEDLF
ncbi:DNase H-like domain protein [Caulobacter phage BL47]|nr:DNase H-like domain protein [Caulobacter phage BL47]UTU10350.1 DNase H-like domain protein [Caulobacter phage RB23]